MDSLYPTIDVPLLVRMGYLLDFKDKVFKLLGTSAKVTAISGSPNAKDLRSFASQLSTARRWMKFGKIIRSTEEILNPVADITLPKSATFNDYLKVFMSKSEFLADLAQMLLEDVNTLHKSKYWSAGLGMKPIKNLDVMEDRAWWVWSLFATLSSLIEMKELRIKLDSAKMRLDALNAAAVPDEVQVMKKEVVILKIKYFMVASKFIKFACELIDSSISLTPDHVKAINPKAFELVSCFVGSVSAISSLHKLLYTESKAIAASKNLQRMEEYGNEHKSGKPQVCPLMLKQNQYQLQMNRLLFAVIAGSIAGIVRVEGILYGIAVFLVWNLIGSVALVMYMQPGKVKEYFPGGVWDVISGQNFSGLLTYILVWTVVYDVVHIF